MSKTKGKERRAREWFFCSYLLDSDGAAVRAGYAFYIVSPLPHSFIPPLIAPWVTIAPTAA